MSSRDWNRLWYAVMIVGGALMAVGATQGWVTDGFETVGSDFPAFYGHYLEVIGPIVAVSAGIGLRSTTNHPREEWFAGLGGVLGILAGCLTVHDYFWTGSHHVSATTGLYLSAVGVGAVMCAAEMIVDPGNVIESQRSRPPAAGVTPVSPPPVTPLRAPVLPSETTPIDVSAADDTVSTVPSTAGNSGTVVNIARDPLLLFCRHCQGVPSLALASSSCEHDLVERGFLASSPRMPTARRGAAFAVVGEELWVIGGLTDTAVALIEAFNPVTQTWRSVGEMPDASWELAAVADASGRVWITGGMDGRTVRNTVWVFQESAWTQLDPPLPYYVSAHAMVASGSTITIVGGWANLEGGKQLHTSGVIWDVENPSDRRRTAPMPYARVLPAACALDGDVVVFGGGTGSRALPDAARYSATEDRWYPLAPMPEPRIGASAINANGVILIVGGKTGPSGTAMATSVLAYDSIRDVWHVPLALPQPRMQPAVGAFVDGTVVIAGGADWERRPLASVDTFGPSTPFSMPAAAAV